MAHGSRDTIRMSISAGLAFLTSVQLRDGEFRTLLGRTPTLGDAAFDSSPFVTAVVCRALRAVGPEAQGLIAKGRGFLAREREFGGLWRYYSSKNFKHRRLPPDLDDTCCASLALDLPSGRQAANRALILSNRDAAGRFGTWMVSRSATPVRIRFVRAIGDFVAGRRCPAAPAGIERDPRFATPTDAVSPDEIDPVVNANVLAYLGDDRETAAASAYLRSLVDGGLTHSSFYYPNPLSLAYAVAKAIESGASSLAGARPALLSAIDEKLQVPSSGLTMLTAGLGVAAYCTLQPPTARIADAAQAIVDNQAHDGSWPREVFYNGPKEFWGSEELTTAVCLEALTKYGRALAG
jgi:hypothetical protein